MTEVAVAVAQFAPIADATANLAAMKSLAASAAARGARLVVFPEYSMYFEPRLSAGWAPHAQSLDGSFVAGLAELAREFSLIVVAGMLEHTPDPQRFSNTLVAVSPAGEVLATYRKLHLYDAFGQKESDFVLAGVISEPQTFELGGFTVGLQTCYDIRFPEVSRRLVDAGVDLIVVPSEWVRGPLKEHHWRTLLTARAIENTVYLAAADHPAPIGAGNSMILDPMGVELATIGEATDVAVAWISPARVTSVRATNPALLLRRFTNTPRV